MDMSTLQEILEAFAQPELKTKMADHPSPFRVPPSIYQHFCRAPPLDGHIAAMHRQQGSVSSSTVMEHRRDVKDLFEVFMAAWRFNCHATVLTCYLQTYLICKDVVEALFEALADQREIMFAGFSSAVSLLC